MPDNTQETARRAGTPDSKPDPYSVRRLCTRVGSVEFHPFTSEVTITRVLREKAAVEAPRKLRIAILVKIRRP